MDKTTEDLKFLFAQNMNLQNQIKDLEVQILSLRAAIQGIEYDKNKEIKTLKTDLEVLKKETKYQIKDQETEDKDFLCSICNINRATYAYSSGDDIICKECLNKEKIVECSRCGYVMKTRSDRDPLVECFDCGKKICGYCCVRTTTPKGFLDPETGENSGYWVYTCSGHTQDSKS